MARDRTSQSTRSIATEARAAMQRRHTRIGFVMTAAAGVEVAGAAGLVVGALLPWEWGEQLVGRADAAGVAAQAAIVVTLLTLAGGWFGRAERLRVRCRVGALLPIVVAGVGAGVVLTQAVSGSRGAGAVVALVAAAAALIGTVGWLVALRQLRVLFPFGLQEARTRGFGNLDTVRRAQYVGLPAGVVGGAVLVTGALLVAPGLVATVDHRTTPALELSAALPDANGAHQWTRDVEAGEMSSGAVLATPGGLVVEEQSGARAVDPRSGDDHWHWRDEAYQRVASVLLDGGQTLVLALTYAEDAGDDGRHKVVALDTSTGELRWERFDDELVRAMQTRVVSNDEGTWFAAAVPPEQPEPAQQPPTPTAPPAPSVPPQGGGQGSGQGGEQSPNGGQGGAQGNPAQQNQQPPPQEMLVADGSDGEVRWQLTPDEECTLQDVLGGTDDTVVRIQDCPAEAPESAGESSESSDSSDAESDDAQESESDDAEGAGEGGAQNGEQAQQQSTSCVLSGHDPASGDDQWSWQPETPTADCQITAARDLMLIGHQLENNYATTALAVDSGERRWRAHRDQEGEEQADGIAGLRNPVQVGDQLVGGEWVEDGQYVELVLRTVAGGELQERIELPQGRPIDITAADDDTVILTHLQTESMEIQLLEVDVSAAEVASTRAVTTVAQDDPVQQVAASTGPETLTVALTYAEGGENAAANPAAAEQPQSYRFEIFGW